MQTLLLYKNKKEVFLFIFILVIIFSSNLLLKYNNFLNFNKNEIFTTEVKIINVYQKEKFDILKLSNNNLVFYTSCTKNNFFQNDFISITILTNQVNFYNYLKGFYTKSFNLFKLKPQNILFLNTKKYINNQHNNKNISEIFNAIFLAIALNKELQSTISSYGIAHLIAISGFHLGVLSFILYYILNIIYKYFHTNYFPYRNKRFDLLILVSIILFFYLSFLSNQASLLRAFVMYIFAIFMLRWNIKLLSFSTLIICILFIIALFPKLLFSLSFWFSICGVFYIFLFLSYFKHINKILLFVFLNVWLYLAINPISHYFFELTSIVQISSPIFTMLFSLFYPIELFLHIFNIGYLFDSYIDILLNYNISIAFVKTNIYFLILYIVFSLLSIKSKKYFIFLNTLIILYNIYLYKSFISV